MKIEIAERSLVLLGEYGSVAQGTATPDSDHDYMGIFIESEEQVIGLDNTDTKRVSDAADGEKSAPGSSDTTYHSFRKFVQLAAGGNPTITSILFLPKYETLTWAGRSLLYERDAFISKKCGAAYLGYMDAQIKAFADTGRKNRVELVEKYGYDIKFAYHAYRLGVQGYTMMTTGTPMLPLTGPELTYAKRIRGGHAPKAEVLGVLDDVRYDLRNSIDKSDLPDLPDKKRINQLLVRVHRSHWDDGKLL